MLTRNNKILISVLIVVLIIAGFVFMKKRKSTNLNTNSNLAATSTNPQNTETVTTIGGVQFSGTNYKIEQVPVQNASSVSVPDLDRKITVSSSVNLSPEAVTYATDRIKSLVALLKKNPKDTGSWIELGAYQKMIGDYDGATISWSYVNKIAPTDYVSLGNLGNLFAYYLHDNLQSEKYYKQAIVNGPTQVYLYVQLAEIYRDIWGDKPRAIAILEQGLAKNPGDENLTKMKKSLEQ